MVSAESQDMLKNFFLCFCLSLTALALCGVEDGLRQISLSDRVNMNFFFDEAIKKDQAGHVLYFENKPACLTGPVLKDKNKSFKESLCLKGWIAFKKHEHLFPHPNFIFNENIYEKDNFKVLDIYIINKKSLEKCLSEHLSVFKEALGQEFSIEQFIAKLEESASLNFLLNKDEMLIGIILGYGSESSQAFKEIRTKCTQTFAPPPTESYQRIVMQQPQGCKIGPVVFMGNPQSDQVKALVSVYEKELEEISKFYKQRKDRLKLILERLCTE